MSAAHDVDGVEDVLLRVAGGGDGVLGVESSSDGLVVGVGLGSGLVVAATSYPALSHVGGVLGALVLPAAALVARRPSPGSGSSARRCRPRARPS